MGCFASLLDSVRPLPTLSDAQTDGGSGGGGSGGSGGCGGSSHLIPASEIILGGTVGTGAFGEVLRAKWQGTDVAVKRLFDSSPQVRVAWLSPNVLQPRAIPFSGYPGASEGVPGLGQDMNCCGRLRFHLSRRSSLLPPLVTALSPQGAQDFQSEVDVLMSLRHSRVILCLGACVQPPMLLIVTEWMPGGSIWSVLRSQPETVDPPTAIRWATETVRHEVVRLETAHLPALRRGRSTEPLLTQALVSPAREAQAQGMVYLHSRYVMHRDLKTANLLIDGARGVKIADFGLARVKQNTQSKTMNAVRKGAGRCAAPLLRSCTCFSVGPLVLITCR